MRVVLHVDFHAGCFASGCSCRVIIYIYMIDVLLIMCYFIRICVDVIT